jgi:MbtH protein
MFEELMMTDGEQLSQPQFEVVVNLQGQYSICPADEPIPSGWRAVGRRAVKSTCLAYLDEIWTDLRPASLTFVAMALPTPRGTPGT